MESCQLVQFNLKRWQQLSIRKEQLYGLVISAVVPLHSEPFRQKKKGGSDRTLLPPTKGDSPHGAGDYRRRVILIVWAYSGVTSRAKYMPDGTGRPKASALFQTTLL